MKFTFGRDSHLFLCPRDPLTLDLLLSKAIFSNVMYLCNFLIIQSCIHFGPNCKIRKVRINFVLAWFGIVLTWELQIKFIFKCEAKKFVPYVFICSREVIQSKKGIFWLQSQSPRLRFACCKTDVQLIC